MFKAFLLSMFTSLATSLENPVMLILEFQNRIALHSPSEKKAEREIYSQFAAKLT